VVVAVVVVVVVIVDVLVVAVSVKKYLYAFPSYLPQEFFGTLPNVLPLIIITYSNVHISSKSLFPKIL
jgi:hypothetical protein